jgi:hypothetical protein
MAGHAERITHHIPYIILMWNARSHLVKWLDARICSKTSVSNEEADTPINGEKTTKLKHGEGFNSLYSLVREINCGKERGGWELDTKAAIRYNKPLHACLN